MATEKKNSGSNKEVQPKDAATPAAKPLRGFARNPALAAAAGRKGGMSVPPQERSFSKNPELARQALKDVCIVTSPREADEEDLLRILERAY